MNGWQALLLGLVQGATEWLPVSSSAHQVLTERALGTEVPVAFDLLLHLGTLVVVILVYRARLAQMVEAVVRTPWDVRQGWADAPRAAPRRLALLLVAATVPIAVAGVLLEARIHAAFGSLPAVGGALLFTGLLLLTTGRGGLRRVRLPQAVWIGLYQVLALFPGISRSGVAIAAGLHGGVEPKEATDFAFLLAIPTLLGAAVFQAQEIGGLGDLGAAPILAGLAGAMTMGWLTLAWMRGLVERRGIRPFGWYCLALGAVVLLLL